MNVEDPTPPHGGRARSAACAADADRRRYPCVGGPRTDVFGGSCRPAAASEVAVSAVAPAAFESLARQAGDYAVPIEWLEQGNKVIADASLSIEWSALPAPMREPSLERLLVLPGKRRVLRTPGRVRLLKTAVK